MAVYNVRIFRYFNGEQIRIYSNIYNAEIEEYKNKRINDIDIKGVDNEEIWNNLEKYEEFLPKFKDDDEIKKDKEFYSRKSRARTVQKIYEITRSNYWEYFVTLTFNPEKVDSFNYDEVVKKLSKWLKNLKLRFAPDLKYIVVPELHKSGRYHFHGLFADIGNMSLIDSGKRLPDGSVIYNLGNYNLGFTTATKIKDMSRVSSYITKYISKELIDGTPNKKRYWASRNLNAPDVIEYVMNPQEIKDMIESLTQNITYAKTVGNDLVCKYVTYLEIR